MRCSGYSSTNTAGPWPLPRTGAFRLPPSYAESLIPPKLYPTSRGGRARLATKIVAALRKDGVSPEVLSVIENAVGRGVIRSLDSYVKRVERFQRTGEYQITHLPPSERAPKKLVLVGPQPRPSSKRVTNKLSA